MRNREDCEYFDRAGRYCIEGPDCLCKKTRTTMPNDNTHTLLPCPFCGADPITWTETISGASTTYAICESDKCREDHTVDSWNTRTPAEPKAGDWEEAADQLHDAIGLLKLGDHPDKVFGEYVFPLFRALSSAAPRITDVTSLQRYRLGLRVVDGIAEAPILEEDPNGSLVAFNHVLNLATPAPRITEEMVERIEDALHQIDQWAKAYPEDIFPRPDLKEANRLLTEGGVSFSALNAYSMNHVIQRVKRIIDGSGIRDLLRQQGAERGEDQQGAGNEQD